MAFVLEQAENQRPCYVFSRDEDLIGPVKKLATEYPWIHYVGDSVERPSVLAGEKKPVLVMPEVVGSLYNMQQGKPLENYLLSTKVPFAGETVDLIVSAHPVSDPVRFVEERASRHLLNIHDIDQLTAVTGYKREMLRSKDNGRLMAAAKTAHKKYPALSFVDVSRSKEGGMLRMGRVDRRTIFTSHGLSHDVTEIPELKWFLAYYGYLRDFSPETLESLRSFRKEFPK